MNDSQQRPLCCVTIVYLNVLWDVHYTLDETSGRADNIYLPDELCDFVGDDNIEEVEAIVDAALQRS